MLLPKIEPVKNLTFQLGLSYRTLESASSTFSLDYYTTLPTAANPAGVIANKVTQSEANIQFEFMPNRKTIGFGVERNIVDSPFSHFFVNFSYGLKGVLNSDFAYQKVQLFYKQPIIIGPLGRSNIIIETGKTFGTIPLGLMSVIPGNQTYFTIRNTFNLLNFYEFEADQYAKETYGGKPLAEALKTLSVKTLSTIHPHPWYVFVNYSHPPLLQRLERLED